jgi:hypothetical protein
MTKRARSPTYDLKNAVNDTGLTFERITEQFKTGDFVDISYGEFGVKVETKVVEEARDEIKSLSPEERENILASVQHDLERNLKAIKAGKLVKKIMDETMHDLVLWHVLSGN